MKARLRRWLQPLAEAVERRGHRLLTVRAGDPLAHRFARFGAGSHIDHPWVALHNPGSVAIGENVEIRSYLCIEALAPYGQVVLEIGDGCIIGHNARFVALNGIVLEPRSGIGHGCTIADSMHDWQAAEDGSPPWATPLILGGPLRIETGAWIGNNCVLVGSITIGACSVIAPNSVVNRDVPPHTLVSGNPARRVPFGRGGQTEAHDQVGDPPPPLEHPG